MDFPNVVVTIPNYLTSDFLGTMALDILHDSKGRGYLAGQPLHKLSDLLATLLDTQDLQNWVFQGVLKYFTCLWKHNLKALGLTEMTGLPDFDSVDPEYWNHWRSIVCMPLHRVADRDTVDTFSSLGNEQYTPESQNYFFQREKLVDTTTELFSFISPTGINSPIDYYQQAIGLVDIIKNRLPNGKVVLDMKSSAGLIRTLTDPIGYTTCLPTYADPGYNMPGMSEIRKYSNIHFLPEQAFGKFRGAQEFRYSINLETPLGIKQFLNAEYFYGVAADGLDRTNVMIKVLEDHFQGALPRSTAMATELWKYLQPQDQTDIITVKEILQSVQASISNAYSESQPTIVNNVAQKLYACVHHHGTISAAELETILEFIGISNSSAHLLNWIISPKGCNFVNLSYILATVKNLVYFPIGDIEITDLYPHTMVTKVLPDVMYRYLEDTNKLSILAFCYHQLHILQQYALHLPDLLSTIQEQWIPRRKGKLITQIPHYVKAWRQQQQEYLENYRKQMIDYIQLLVQTCVDNFGLLEEPQILTVLPPFQPDEKLGKILLDHLHFYQPELFGQTMSTNRMGLAFSSLLDMLIWTKPVCDLGIDLEREYHIKIPIGSKYYDFQTQQKNTLQTVLGKFSGDFGQIMWCIANSQIFASEDNNASAMAILLHRIPQEYTRGTTGCWANIHGLGDGSAVDITVRQK